MKQWRALIAAVLLAFWPAVSSHAFLQVWGLIHLTHVDPDGAGGPEGSPDRHDNDHEVADGQCRLSTQSVEAPVPSLVGPPLWLCDWILAGWPLPPEGEPPASGLAPPRSAPPELRHRWQFSLRAALPVRAPSLVS